MLTFRPYGAGILFDACNYKHFVPTGLMFFGKLIGFAGGFADAARLWIMSTARTFSSQAQITISLHGSKLKTI
ncbi:MAG: hypothetical protein V7641_4708 [Blastocatellia bacterium]